jgi:hypothetical protein
MINRHGRSDSAIVAERPTNKAGQLAAEPGERRAESKGNAAQQSTRRAQNRESVSQALDRIRQVASTAMSVVVLKVTIFAFYRHGRSSGYPPIQKPGTR